MPQEIIKNTLLTRDEFHSYLNQNEGIVVIKFGADWCGPCQRVKQDIHKLFMHTPENVTCFDIDVDNCSDLYFYLKNKRQVNGIPAILVYHTNNKTFAPDISQTGANLVEIRALFNVVNKMANDLL